MSKEEYMRKLSDRLGYSKESLDMALKGMDLEEAFCFGMSVAVEEAALLRLEESRDV